MTERKQYQEAMTAVVNTLEHKGNHYKEQPLDYMDIDHLLPIVRLKVERAIQVKTLDKKVDDVLDTVCYSMKILQRLLDMQAAEKAKLTTICAEDVQ